MGRGGMVVSWQQNHTSLSTKKKDTLPFENLTGLFCGMRIIVVYFPLLYCTADLMDAHVVHGQENLSMFT